MTPGGDDVDDATRLQGADATVVRAARSSGDALPGTAGFAGLLDGELVRDVLGRYPLFSSPDWPLDGGIFERPAGEETSSAGPPTGWSHDPTSLESPVRVPAGHVRDAGGTRPVWSLPAPAARTDRAAAVEAVQAAVDRAVASVPPGDDLAVAFSGGLDSALLASRFDAPLYVVGFPDSPDISAARGAAALLDRDLAVVELDHDALEAAVSRVVRATTRTNAMDVAIALPLLCVAEAAAADGFDRLVLGQGADELFGGYAKVAKAPEDDRVTAATVRGARREVTTTLPDQLERDVLAVRAAGVEPVIPYCHDAVVGAALALPEDLLVSGDGVRKRALREVARGTLPDAIADRDKRAMQYGSRVSRELDRLARQAGFKRRQDDHVTAYVESLCDRPVRIETPPG